MKNSNTNSGHFSRLNAIVDGGHLAGLSHSALAVLFVLVRAQDSNGDSFHSLKSIASFIGMDRRSVIRGLAELKSGMIVECRKAGCGRGNRAVHRVLLIPTKGDSPVTVSDAQRVTALSRKGDSPVQQRVTALSDQPKHTTITEQHIEVSHEQPSARGSRRWSDSDVELIWKVYPKKVGKPSGIKAIRKALDRIAKRNTADPVNWLLDRVKAYAQSVVGTEPHYIKNPQGWFNDDRFDGDFSTPNGHRNGNGNGHPVASTMPTQARMYDRE